MNAKPKYVGQSEVNNFPISLRKHRHGKRLCVSSAAIRSVLSGWFHQSLYTP